MGSYGAGDACGIQRSVYTSSSKLFFCIWDSTGQKMFFAFSPCSDFQNWGAHLCAQGMWGEQQTFQTSPTSGVKKLSLVCRLDSGSHFLAFNAVPLARKHRLPPTLEFSPSFLSQTTKATFFDFCSKEKKLTRDKVISFWLQQVQQTSDVEGQIHVLLTLCHQVLLFSRLHDLCFDECIMCLWFLRTLSEDEIYLPCSASDCTLYLSSALGQRMVLVSKRKERVLQVPVDQDDLSNHALEKKKMPKISTVLKTLKKPMKSIPVVRYLLGPYIKCLALCQDAKENVVENASLCEDIIFFEAFVVKQLRYYVKCYRQKTLQEVCHTCVELIDSSEQLVSIKADLIFSKREQQTGSTKITSYPQDVLEAAGNTYLACNPEYLRCALFHLSDLEEKSVVQVVVELKVWLRKNQKGEFSEPPRYLLKHFPRLLNIMLESAKAVMEIVEPTEDPVKKEKIQSFFRLQNFKDQCSILLSVFGMTLGSDRTEEYKVDREISFASSPVKSSTPLTDPSGRQQHSSWMVPNNEVDRFAKLWRCLCLAFSVPPAYRTIFTKPWFYKELLSVYQIDNEESGFLDVIQLGRALEGDRFISDLRQKSSKRWALLVRAASTTDSVIRSLLRKSLVLWVKIYASVCAGFPAEVFKDNPPLNHFLGFLRPGADQAAKEESLDEWTTPPSLQPLQNSCDLQSRSTIWTLQHFILVFCHHRWEILPAHKEALVSKCQIYSSRGRTAFCRPLFGRQGRLSIVFKTKQDFCLEEVHTACLGASTTHKHPLLPSPSSHYPPLQFVLTPSNIASLLQTQNQEIRVDTKAPTKTCESSMQRKGELFSFSLFLRYRNVAGHFFTLNSHIIAPKIYPQQILFEAERRGWLTFQGAKQETCIPRLKNLPTLTSAHLNELDSFVASSALHFSVVQDLALLLLFLQNHLPKRYSRWLSPLLSSKMQNLWLSPCSYKCKFSCFCIYRLRNDLSWSQVDQSNLMPWFNLILILLARHVALFRVVRGDPSNTHSCLRLHILNTEAWLLLLNEVQSLLVLTGDKDEDALDHPHEPEIVVKSNQTSTWKKKKSLFDLTWAAYLKKQRFLHLKSYDPNSKFHRYLADAFESSMCSRRRKLEITRKYVWFAQTPKEQDPGKSTDQGISIDKSVLTTHMKKILKEDKNFTHFKFGFFLENMLKEEEPPILSRSASLSKSSSEVDLIPTDVPEVQRCLSILKNAPLDRSLEAASSVYAKEYMELVQIFQKANAFFMREGNADIFGRKSSQAMYFHNLLPWPPSILHCLMYLEQIAALTPRRACSTQPLISLQAIVPPGQSWYCCMLWVFVAYLLLDETVSKAIGDPPCVILIDPTQLQLFDLVINVFDALVRIPSFAERHAIQWICDKNAAFILSTKNPTFGSWVYHQRPTAPFPNKRNILIISSTSELHPAMLDKGFGRVLNLLPMSIPPVPSPVLPSCLVVLEALPAPSVETLREHKPVVTLKIQATPLSVNIDLLEEFRRGGFLRPSETGRVPLMFLPRVLRVFLQDTRPSEEVMKRPTSSLQKVKLGNFLDLKQKSNKKASKGTPTRAIKTEGKVKAAPSKKVTDDHEELERESMKPEGDYALPLTLPPTTIPTLGSILLFFENNLRQPNSTPKKHYKLFRGHLWPNKVRPHVSRENLSTCFYLLRQLLEPDHSGECEIPPLAPRRMRFNLSKHELLLQRSHRESELCCQNAANELTALVPEARIKRLSVLPGMHLYAILKVQAVALVRQTLEDTFGLKENVRIITPQEAFGSPEQCSPGTSSSRHEPTLVLGTWQEFMQASAIMNQSFQVPLRKPSHLFFDEAYSNKLKTHFSWIFTNHMHLDIPEDLLSLWSVR